MPNGDRRSVLDSLPMQEKFTNYTIKIEWHNGWECWLWQGYLVGKGYGGFKQHHYMYLAHRVSYEVFVERIPDGLVIDHLCRRLNCINPDHLEPVTSRENTLRGKSKIANFARRTHCNYGHPFSGENLRIMSGGYRSCRECERTYREKHDQFKRRREFKPRRRRST